jgi:DNA-binding beta-propeller fold protein YncE
MKTIILAVLATCALPDGFDPNRDGRLVLVAGGGSGGDGGPADQAKLDGPFGVAWDPSGELVFVEINGHRVRRVGKNGILTTIAGTSRQGSGGDGGPAKQAEFHDMHHLAIARNGDIYIADTLNNKARKIDAQTGRITTILGTGKKGFSGDGGPATQADCGGIYCLALDEPGQKLYAVDLDNRRIRVVDLKSGIVSTFAGNGQKGIPPDGSDARNTPLFDPRAVAIDGRGNVYILERSGHALRVVDRSGKIRTVAGTGEKGNTGDGGDARKAKLSGPKHLCVDERGNVIIADSDNHRIRMYRPSDGMIQNIAGTGRPGTAGLGGPPGRAELNFPHGVNVGPDGILYIVDSHNDRILKIVP